MQCTSQYARSSVSDVIIRQIKLIERLVRAQGISEELRSSVTERVVRYDELTQTVVRSERVADFNATYPAELIPR